MKKLGLVLFISLFMIHCGDKPSSTAKIASTQFETKSSATKMASFQFEGSYAGSYLGRDYELWLETKSIDKESLFVVFFRKANEDSIQRDIRFDNQIYEGMCENSREKGHTVRTGGGMANFGVYSYSASPTDSLIKATKHPRKSTTIDSITFDSKAEVLKLKFFGIGGLIEMTKTSSSIPDFVKTFFETHSRAIKSEKGEFCENVPATPSTTEVAEPANSETNQ